jgi:hypothetical protein
LPAGLNAVTFATPSSRPRASVTVTVPAWSPAMRVWHVTDCSVPVPHPDHAKDKASPSGSEATAVNVTVQT